jgi:hyperosmotically inducible periplasmic protein
MKKWLFFAFLFTSVTVYAAQQLKAPATRDIHRIEALKEEIRHQLLSMPYYSVFDWIEGEVKPDGTVTLKGEVTRPTIKDDAAGRVKQLESVTKLNNEIEVLPLSPNDDRLRVAVYRAIFNFDSPLFRYATQSVPPIHIIVKNGNVALKGIVANQGDSEFAEIKARGVSGTFDVKNELQVEQRLDEKVSRK